MSALISSVESFTTGQKVLTGFGPGVVSAISYVDSIIYVTLSKEPAGLYIFRPEQVEPIDVEPIDGEPAAGERAGDDKA